MNGRCIFYVNGKHYRMVFIHKNGDYRIESEIGGFGKLHHDFSEYVKRIKKNGWLEVDFRKFIEMKYRGY